MMFKKISIPLSIIAIVGIVAVAFFTHNSSAVTAAQWKAGNIIDDALFIDKNAMSVDQIQAFLNSKVPVCDSYGTLNVSYWYNPSDGSLAYETGSSWVTTTRAIYGQRYSAYKGNTNGDIPYTCLKDYYEVPKTEPGPGIPENNFGGKAIPAGARSAAQLIWDAAQKYNISPKVLLVKLGTESAGPLTSDDWPFINQYTYAMGAHCPDSGPGGSANCDTDYAGFSIQISEAASLLRWYLDSMTQAWWSYKKPYQVNSILWNIVESGCGRADVFIDNRATAALYTYTPYQPNQAALNNMYGTGDGCSAYGNRNFWRTYNDWFGSSNEPATFGYSIVSGEIYSDETYQTKISATPTVEPNTTFYVKLTIKNTGNQVWYKDSLRLGCESPKDRESAFADASWLSTARPAAMNETTVAGGETATFTFKMKTPSDLGLYNESFGILIENQRWLNGTYTVPITVASASPYYSAKTISFDTYSDAAMTSKINSSSITKYTDSKLYVKTVIKNTGNQVFPSGTTKLATSNPIDRTSAFSDGSWIDSTRVTTAEEGDILPQETGTFTFSISTPSTPLARTQEQFGLLIEFDRWLSYNVGTISVQTNQRPPTSLNTNQVLSVNESVVSSNEKYALILQSDGNLVLYSQGKAIWASWTVGKGGVKLIMQTDGNLVMYDKDWKAIWNSKTSGKGTSFLCMQDDGNLVIYNTKSYTWASWTVGR